MCLVGVLIFGSTSLDLVRGYEPTGFTRAFLLGGRWHAAACPASGPPWARCWRLPSSSLTAPLTAAAFLLAVRHLMKACSIRVGVALHRQEGTSDWPLPVSISEDGCTDRGLVTDRAESCFTGFHHVGSALQQQSSRLSSSWEKRKQPSGVRGEPGSDGLHWGANCDSGGDSLVPAVPALDQQAFRLAGTSTECAQATLRRLPRAGPRRLRPRLFPRRLPFWSSRTNV